MPDSSSSRPIVNPWLIAATVMLSTILEVLDTSIVNVSLPHIAGSLASTIDQATWVLTSYLVANAIVLPITGWLGNYFGRKRLLMVAVGGFTVSSMLCGLAPSLGFLVLFRVLQGAFGGSLQPISQAVLLETFPPEKRGQAMAVWGMGIVVAPILGPMIGGYLTDALSWRWVFYINLPIGILALAMTYMFIFDPSYIRRHSDKVDGWGLGMLAVGIAALQILLDKGQQDDWFGSHFIIILTVLSVVGLAAFIFRELTTEHPIVNLRVFKNRTYSTGVLLMTVLGFVLYGSLVLLPLFLQTLLGYTAFQAGLWTGARGLGSLVFMPLCGMLLGRRWSTRALLMAGILTASTALFILSSFNLQISPWNVFWQQAMQGSGLAFIFVPLTTATMDPIPNKDMGNATSLFNLMRNVGGSVGIAVTNTLVARREQFHQMRLGSRLTANRGAVQQMLAAAKAHLMAQGENAFTASRQALALLYFTLRQQAALLSYRDEFYALAVLFLVLSPLVWVMRKPHSRGAAPMH